MKDYYERAGDQAGSKKKNFDGYKSNLNMLDILPPARIDFVTKFNNAKSLIKEIRGARYNGELYSQNTWRKRIQTILFLINKAVPSLKNLVSKQAMQEYDYAYQVEDVASRKAAADATENEIISFEDYLPLVEEEFGKDSKEYLIAKLYDNIPGRDDFQLVIVKTVGETTDQKVNYIVVPDKGDCTVVVNQYKTQSKYGHDSRYPLDKATSALVRKYIKAKRLAYGSYLLGKGLLSGPISKFNDKLDLPNKVTISTYRKMWISRELPEDERDATYPKVVALAPGFGDYQSKTSRVIPLFELQRV